MLKMVRGDIDGFFGLALDNLVQLLVIMALCMGVIGCSAQTVFGHILPGAAVSLIFGNVFYAWQARRVMAQTGRSDVCALPYGINTPSVFLFLFLVMLPAKFAGLGAGLSEEDAALRAWQLGLLACFGSGVIELIGSVFAERIRKATPRAALLSTLAGIAVGFISMPFFFKAYAHPLVGLVPFGIILIGYFGGMRFKGGLPAGLVAVLLGTILAWTTGFDRGPLEHAVGFYPPTPVIGDLFAAMSLLDESSAVAFISVVLAMGVFNVIGSLQNIESAEAAGDRFDTRSSLAVNGLGTVLASFFGSCFPTTIYIGHPGWKAMGARSGYSILNAIFCTIICCTGTLALIEWAVPIEATMAIVIWIALIITAQAFQTTPSKHAPAVVIGLLPGIAAWGVLMIKAGMRAGGLGSETPFSAAVEPAFFAQDVAITGAWAIEQGALFTCMILAAATVAIIERQWYRAAIWFIIGAVLSATGLMHGYAYGFADVTLSLQWGMNGWAWAYAMIAAICALTPHICEPLVTDSQEDDDAA